MTRPVLKLLKNEKKSDRIVTGDERWTMKKGYQKYFGVNKRTFEKMREILEEADRYKRRRFALRVSLICAIYNF